MSLPSTASLVEAIDVVLDPTSATLRVRVGQARAGLWASWAGPRAADLAVAAAVPQWARDGLVPSWSALLRRRGGLASDRFAGRGLVVGEGRPSACLC